MEKKIDIKFESEFHQNYLLSVAKTVFAVFCWGQNKSKMFLNEPSKNSTKRNDGPVIVKREMEWQTAKSWKVVEEKRVEEKRRLSFQRYHCFYFHRVWEKKAPKTRESDHDWESEPEEQLSINWVGGRVYNKHAHRVHTHTKKTTTTKILQVEVGKCERSVWETNNNNNNNNINNNNYNYKKITQAQTLWDS